MYGCMLFLTGFLTYPSVLFSTKNKQLYVTISCFFYCYRVRIGNAPLEREVNPNRQSALEVSMRAYISKRDGNVVNPVIGTSFDSLDEAYQFYNLFSWEVGFGIKYAKSRLNVHRSKCMQEIVCGCAVSYAPTVILKSENAYQCCIFSPFSILCRANQ